MASLTEIAELAGLSTATVSRVLSGSSHPVSERARERVQRAADTLGFHPNMLARGLVTKRSHTAAVIVHDISDPYFAEIVRGVEDCAHRNEYRVFISSSDRDPQRELSYVRSFLQHRVDMLLFAGGGFADESYRAELNSLLSVFRQDHAVVRLSPDSDGLPFVSGDNAGGGAAITKHLIDLGHRRIGFIDGPPRFSASLERGIGYRAALQDAGIAFDDELCEPGHFSEDGGASAAAALLARCPTMTAIFAANDLMAIGAMRELHRQGVHVPEQVSVAGFDDIRMTRYLQPSLTTVRVPMHQMGRQAFDMAMAILDGEPIEDRRLDVELRVRESTSAPKR